MKFQFLLNSDLLQDDKNHTKFYQEAIKSNSLIENGVDNEISIENLSDEFIKKTIDTKIQNITPDHYEFNLAGLDGGLRIQHRHKVIEHQCCSELNDYKNWRKILNEPCQEWTEIWIGHPQIFYRIKGKNIELSEYYDVLPEENVQIKFSLNKDVFSEKLKSELKKLEDFKKNLYRIIDNGNYLNKEVLKKALLA